MDTRRGQPAVDYADGSSSSSSSDEEGEGEYLEGNGFVYDGDPAAGEEDGDDQLNEYDRDVCAPEGDDLLHGELFMGGAQGRAEREKAIGNAEAKRRRQQLANRHPPPTFVRPTTSLLSSSLTGGSHSIAASLLHARSRAEQATSLLHHLANGELASIADEVINIGLLPPSASLQQVAASLAANDAAAERKASGIETSRSAARRLNSLLPCTYLTSTPTSPTSSRSWLTSC